MYNALSKFYFCLEMDVNVYLTTAGSLNTMFSGTQVKDVKQHISDSCDYIGKTPYVVNRAL